ncbi:MAG: biotin-dependent carboxyltransferase [Xanthobacteraceae bacterium]|nr:biotin-dependent carboxyltransferase [Xanthobacteraceae bacterium]
MTPALSIVRPGLLTTIQDLGRLRHQSLGIAVCGALDPVALRAANALAGNPPETGALEVLHLGPTMVVEAENVRMAFAGARAALEILPDLAATHGRPIETMRSVRLHRGEIIRIGSLAGSAALYVAVEGGFDIPPVLGSLSTDIRAGIGGWQGRALVAGDHLPLRGTSASPREELRITGLDLSPPSVVRAILGPQHDFFSASEIEAFFARTYTVGAGSNRMGMRLEGARIAHARGHNITSDAIAPGSVQVPGNGQPIILLADRQTTGGYPKIATVISADLPAVGRLTMGATIRFESVTIEEALRLRRLLIDDITRIPERIEPVRNGAGAVELAPKLSRHNLISGVVDAGDWIV